DRVGKGGIEVLNIFTARDELASRSQNPWAGDAAGFDRVTQFSITINARVTEVANGRNAALKIFASEVCAHQSALRGRFHDGQQVSGRKNPVLMALCLRFRRHNDVEK